MISTLVLVASILGSPVVVAARDLPGSSALVAAQEKAPRSRSRARERSQREWPRVELDLDVDVPDFLFELPHEVLPHVSRDFMTLSRDLMTLPRDLMTLPPLLAFGRHDRDEDDDEKDDEDGDSDGDGHFRVYRMDSRREIRDVLRGMPFSMHDEEEDFERNATGQARGKGTASLPVKGPVTFQLRAQNGDVEVVAADRGRVVVTLQDSPSEDVGLYAFGDRVEVTFRGRRQLRRGKLRVEVPKGSRVDLSSMSGDLTVESVGGDARIRTMSGDVKLSGVTRADVQTISGDARIEETSGPVRLHTVSGHATIATTATAPQLEFQSASGSLDWSGLCGRDCRVAAETVSGTLRFAVDPGSSFELSYTSHSGEMRDGLNLAVKRAPRRKRGFSGGLLEATYGKGEGVIECDAFSGSVEVKKR